ncbi:AMP-binding protein, partial [Paenibacillus sp. HJL G12]
AMQPVPVGVTGDLYIGGIQLARGYHVRPELTQERFLPDPFSDEPGSRIYKTGDLARYLPDGSLEYAGRSDDQIKLRGFRIELGEIEATLLKHPKVLESAVIARDEERGGKRLIGYWVSQEPGSTSAAELRNFLKGRLPEYMVPAAWMELDRMPLTPSGKTDRRQLPMPKDVRPEAAFVAPESPAERQLAEIWKEVLGVQQVGVHDNFFILGGHSLMATQLASWIRDSMQIDLSLKVIFENPTIAEMAIYIEKNNPSSNSEASDEMWWNDEEDHPLSFAQRRLWFLNQFMDDKTAYMIPGAIRLIGKLNAEALRDSLNEMINRHESLRVSFKENNGMPFIEISNNLFLDLSPVSCPFQDADKETVVQRLAAEEARRPFDLTQAPLIRATLIRLGEGDHLLLITMHHIISDGWSLSVFTQELSQLYNAFIHGKSSPLPSLPFQYSHYAVWQRRYLSGANLERQIDYWKKQLEGTQPVLQLPTDYDRPEQQSFRGGSLRFKLDASLTGLLQELGRSEGATWFMTLLAAFNILLGRYTNEEDIVIGTPIANRNRKEIEPLIGFFANTLVLRTDLSGAPDFRQLLRRVRENCLQAYDHEDVPFEKLVELLQPERNPKYSPLFQVMFILQNNELPALELEGIQAETVEVDQGTSKFDLTVSFEEKAGGFEGCFEYNLDLFRPETIGRMAANFQALLQSIADDPDQNIHTLPMFSDVERDVMSLENPNEWNSLTLQVFTRLFEQQVQRTPDATAIMYKGQGISYAELNKRSNQLARLLQKAGVSEETVVAILMERSPSLIIAFLAVLKSGGACVPIDPGCSNERLDYILENSGVKWVLTQECFAEKIQQESIQIITVDPQWTDLHSENDQNLEHETRPEQLACLMYTSGSGGIQKGVRIRHHLLASMTKRLEKFLQPEATGNHLRPGLNCSIESEAFLGQLQYLLHGHALDIVPQAIRTESTEFISYVRENGIERFTCTPTQLRLLLGEGLTIHTGTALRVVWVSGEPLDKALWNRLAECKTIHFYHFFGMIEQAGASLGCRVTARGKPSLGHALHGVEQSILNRHMQPVPWGAIGELYFRRNHAEPLYWGETQKVAHERTINSPTSSSEQSGWFGTGDLVRGLSDGSIEYVGRLDREMNVNGVRMEYGQIEEALYDHPAVRQVYLKSVVIESIPRLVAYVMLSERIEMSEIHSHLRSKLPGYMIPFYLVEMDDFPLIYNGRIKADHLPIPDLSSIVGETDEEPRNAIEALLTEYCRELLGVPEIGIHHNFFDMGGHSLLAMEVIAYVRNAFGVQLSVKTLFDLPTVAQLSNEIERLLIEEIENMDEEEARMLLEAE